MNTSIISHRLFVAALTHDDGASEHLPPTAPEFEADRAAQKKNGPSAKTLAALASRPWVNWPFGGAMEEPATS